MKHLSRRTVPFILVIVVIILVNVASTTLFFRGDLTRNKIYSLSQASKETVATLREPLTIKAFFSPNLPAPYNNTQRLLRDLLEEYSIAANEYFNYSITTVQAGDATGGRQGSQSPEAEEARNYRINPIQIQNVQQDEVKLQTAYMGVAFIHGDMLETIPALTDTSNLEYRITSLINKMSDKISKLLSMKRDINVTLYITENLFSLSEVLESLPEELETAVNDLNSEFYGRLDFEYRTPTVEEADRLETEYGVNALTLRRQTGQGETTEKAYAALVTEHGERYYVADLISRGIFGGLSIADAESVEQTISDTADALIGVSEEVGFMTGYGVPSLQGQQQQSPVPTMQTDLSNFNAVVSEEFQLRQINLEEERIPEGLSSLVVVSPSQTLSDIALYQLDQFLMRGNDLVLFLDSHSVVMPQQSNQFSGQQPAYIPRDTGLEDLIAHYGLNLKPAYLLDEESFVQRQRGSSGGIVEIPVYYAPIIQPDSFNEELGFLRNMPRMVVLNMSPVTASEDLPEGVTAHPLFSSSEDGWEMSGNINLSNPYMIQVPEDDQQSAIPMGYLLEGELLSYFADREIPEPPGPGQDATAESDTGDAADAADEARPSIEEDAIELEASKLESGRGRLVVIGGSGMLGSNVIDREGQAGNATFVLNLFDFVNDRTDYAVMRTKNTGYAPLEETTPAKRSFIKTFNIAGLAVIVALAGVAVWFGRVSRKKRIQGHFAHRGAAAGSAVESGATGADGRDSPADTARTPDGNADDEVSND